MSYEVDLSRAEILIEALPFIQKHRGKTFVIKYGGSAMEDQHLVERTLRDVVFLAAVGIQPVIVHGGGKAITNRMREAKIKAQFVNGLRVTDAASMAIVESTLDEVINPMIVSHLEAFTGIARGISGKVVFQARKVGLQSFSGPAPAVDLGLVGDVVKTDLEVVIQALSDGAIPVISPLGIDGGGVVLNVNADVAAAALAAKLQAAKLIYISDVRGIMRDPSALESLIPSVTSAQITKLVEDGIISGGMIPKVQSAVESLARGVGAVHLIDGRIGHALLLEIFQHFGGTGRRFCLELEGRWVVFQKARGVYDGSVKFCGRFLRSGDGTIDQQAQGAFRKQNSLKANQASGTPKEAEIMLINLARAKLEELLEDHRAYVLVRGLELWGKDSRLGCVCPKARASAEWVL